MALRDRLTQHASLTIENNIFFQKEIERSGTFEKMYIQLRDKEGRVYSDDIAKYLPAVPKTHSTQHEWLTRSISLRKLISYLKKRDLRDPILEIGCGNGWFSHNLAVSLEAELCAMDVNEIELQQGSRIFNACKNLVFVYADIFTLPLSAHSFGTIILASSIQYFVDLKKLIRRLLELLAPNGEIHILDSPFYSPATVKAARERSSAHFHSLGFPEMINAYFHHTIQELDSFNNEVFFNPKSVFSIINRNILRIPQPIFPWIVIKRR